MKYKKIPNSYFPTIIDRLFRIEPAYIRYERVVCDIINKFYFDSRKNNLKIEDKINIACYIFNSSLSSTNIDTKLNQIILDLENKYFVYNPASYQYLSIRFNIAQMINEIAFKPNLAQSIIWLKTILKSNENPVFLRNKHSLLFPIEKIILCEGQTEELLLDNICKIFNLNFMQAGIKVIAAGGKNQVAKKFYQMVEYTKLPFFILLDKDAFKIKELIEPKLRKIDTLYILNSGEFEDLFSNQIIKNTINLYHNNDFQCSLNDFSTELSMVDNLKIIYKKYGYGDFKKAEFAKLLTNYIATLNKNDLNKSEISLIIESLKKNLNTFTLN